ncbi:MAG: D-glycero-beta-D-manno-heptose 1-phosphate adenylyltransferase [Ignavibacteriae bacterium]|jgi:D-beta-D-heptose 7-phosphate kinase/D-beta-D-heptose 1-phosphate adenosyltransferase|nr:D-glycero-beta-D-manno-heptose 1-phosphate adenylyltransferase [Ignavibacteriota bacterium]NOG97003.1 D-glycero-beta-D-manno-heptose 1-phosphate adenylyltransferase [Ignavibacteriota bacterium]
MNNIIKDRNELIEIRKRLREENKKVVFSNGCFDILHAGHVDYLNKARAFGDVLIVALNTDASVKRLKGNKRPIVKEEERAFVMANLKAVDYVTFFEEDTPAQIIDDIIPDILVKGADWKIDNIVGRETVEKNGGKVERIEFVNFQSTSGIIDTIIKKFKD